MARNESADDSTPGGKDQEMAQHAVRGGARGAAGRSSITFRTSKGPNNHIIRHQAAHPCGVLPSTSSLTCLVAYVPAGAPLAMMALL